MKKLLFLLLLPCLVHSQISQVHKVQTITQLKTLNFTTLYVYVSDSARLFSTCSPCTADEVNIFAGAGGKKWQGHTTVIENAYIKNQSSVLQHGEFAIDGTIKVGTTQPVDARIQMILKDTHSDNTGFALSEWKTYNDPEDLNIGGLAIVKHDKDYGLTSGYADASQLYTLAKSAGLIIGSNNFVGADTQTYYHPVFTDIPNGFVRVEVGPIWPESEVVRFNPEGTIFGWTTLRQYVASQTSDIITDPINSFFPSDVGKWFAWGNRELGGKYAFIDSIVEYIDANHIRVNKPREIAAQGARVVQANGFINKNGDARFRILFGDSLRIGDEATGYYRFVPGPSALKLLRVGASSPDTLLDLRGTSKIYAPRDIALNGSHYSKISFNKDDIEVFGITSNNTVTEFKNTSASPFRFITNGVTTADFKGDVNNFFKPVTIGSQTSALASLDVENTLLGITSYFDNTKGSGTKYAGIFSTVNAGTNNGILVTVNGGTVNKGLIIDVPSSANNYAVQSGNSGKWWLNGSLNIFADRADGEAAIVLPQTTSVPSNGISWNDVNLYRSAVGELTIQGDLHTNNLSAGSVSNAEFQYLANVSADIQGQFSGKADASHTHAGADIISGTVATARLDTATINAAGYAAINLRSPIASPTFTGTVITGVFQTNATNTSSNLAVVSGNGIGTTTNAGIIFGGASQIKARIWLNGGNGTLATNDSYAGLIAGNTGTITGASAGTHALGANVLVKGITFVPNATTPALMTNLSSFAIDAPSIGGVNNWSMYIRSGNSLFGGDVISNTKFQAINTPVGSGATDSANTVNRSTGTIETKPINLNGSAITAGTVATARLDTATINAAGNTALNTRATITYTDGKAYDLAAAYRLLGSAIIAEGVGTSASQITTSFALGDGGRYSYLVYLPVAATLTGIKYYLNTAGVFTGDNENSVTLYSVAASGTATKVATSANDENIWKTTTGFRSIAFTGTYAAAVGWYAVDFNYNRTVETTPPAIGCFTSNPSAVVPSLDFTNSIKISCSTASATSPSTYTMGSMTADARRWFVGLY